jgi:hypothetical protein
MRYAPEWKGVLAFNQFDLMPVAVRATPWEDFPMGVPGPTTKTA